MTDLLTVDESIDRKALKWERWGGMVRHHPNFLGAILASLPEAKDEKDSFRKLVAIYHWLKDLDVDLCDLCVSEGMDQETYEFKLYPYISFGSSPYGPASQVPLIGTRYHDPKFKKIKYEDRLTSLILNLRDRQWPDEATLLGHWPELVQKAEKDYFDNDPQAPVCIFEWELGDNKYSVHRHIKSWHAGNTIIDMKAGNRRMVSGFRKQTQLPWFAMDGAPEEIKQWKGDFQLDLTLYQPSPLLIATREAKKLESNTVNTSTSTTTSRRVL